MKNNKISFAFFFLLLIALIGVGTGCKKALETKVYSQLTPQNFYQSEGDANAALITLYIPFTSNWGNTDPGNNTWYAALYNADIKSYLLRSVACTDEISTDWDGNLTNFTWGASTWTGANEPTYYKISYVAKATEVIDAISKSTKLTDAVKKSYVAQAKTLRAWLMYTLYDFYGPVNVKTDPAVLTDTANTPRLTKEAYSAQIEKDIQEALPDLNDKYNADAPNWGRVSKGVAKMILLKLYMHNKDWAKAETTGKEIINMGYALQTGAGGYANVFKAKANNEIIYAVPANDASPNYWVQEVLPGDFKTGGPIARGPGWGGYFMPWAFYDKYEAGDLRKSTIIDSYTKQNGAVNNRASGLRGAIPLKYTGGITNDGPGYAIDVVVFRLGEVMLSVAEAINEQRGPADAYQYVNQIRARAGVADFSGMTQVQLRAALLDERGRELYGEGERRQDLVRNGSFISDALARGKTNAKATMTLFPIPNAVIVAGRGIIQQNLGY
ncbi:MAG: RagB/SusD family nutrient uptake outer membrane protein [Chitinophagaceae bacterium]